MKAALAVAALTLAGGLAACASDVDEPWFLDHDRIVAVRATPPRIPAGGRAELDALVATKGAATVERVPELATVVSPTGWDGVLAPDGDRWVVTAPDESAMVAARDQLGLEAGAPVPVQIGVSFAGGTLVALKTVWLGAEGDNPTLTGLAIDGAPPPDGEVEVGTEVDVRLAVDADAATMDVNWLTSCGTMHDFDLPSAYLRVEPDDPKEGQLAVVLRDREGGVTWRLWSIRAR
ncbi:MAG TPA: hypothetical protein VM734_32515, partial [Kofleriaceae bacterium]|nr:hypothetical protein [Kofleriaceae bacterium]